jgi:hypothetical protein
MSFIPLYPSDNNVVHLNTGAHHLELMDMLERRIYQAEAIAGLIAAYNPNDPVTELPDDALTNAAWAICDQLQEIRVYADMLQQRTPNPKAA